MEGLSGGDAAVIEPGFHDGSSRVFPGKLGLQQRVLPAYRAPFFTALAQFCDGGLSVLAGQPLADEAIVTTQTLREARYHPARNWNFLNASSPAYLCWQGGIYRWLESWQPDALIIEANSRYLSNRFALRWMHARNRPVIGWGLGAPAINGFLSGVRRWERLNYLRSLDAVIAYSKQGAEEYRALGIPDGRIFVAANAVAPRPASPPPDRPGEFASRPAVLFVGRLQARKRIDNLLRACSTLPEGLQPRLCIVGDGPARWELEVLAAEIYPRTEFLGARSGAELSSVFAGADLFVLPGTGGLAVQEAMAYGLPVIVAEGDGTQSQLVRPGNGWLVQPGDQDALREALAQALSDVDRLRRMGRESYNIVREEVNLERMVAVFLDVLAKVTAR